MLTAQDTGPPAQTFVKPLHIERGLRRSQAPEKAQRALPQATVRLVTTNVQRTWTVLAHGVPARQSAKLQLIAPGQRQLLRVGKVQRVRRLEVIVRLVTTNVQRTWTVLAHGRLALLLVNERFLYQWHSQDKARVVMHMTMLQYRAIRAQIRVPLLLPPALPGQVIGPCTSVEQTLRSEPQ